VRLTNPVLSEVKAWLRNALAMKYEKCIVIRAFSKAFALHVRSWHWAILDTSFDTNAGAYSTVH
jgi:hypothetical protein